jgi:hypothetical protein
VKPVELGSAGRNRHLLTVACRAHVTHIEAGDVIIARKLTWLERLCVLFGTPVSFRLKRNTTGGKSDG